jgi:hypothetical protein
MVTPTNNLRLSKQRTPFCKLTLGQHLSTLQQRPRSTSSPIRYTLFIRLCTARPKIRVYIFHHAIPSCICRRNRPSLEFLPTLTFRGKAVKRGCKERLKSRFALKLCIDRNFIKANQYYREVQIFHKCSSHLKVTRTTGVTSSKFQAAQNFVARVTWHLGFVHPCNNIKMYIDKSV